MTGFEQAEARNEQRISTQYKAEVCGSLTGLRAQFDLLAFSTMSHLQFVPIPFSSLCTSAPAFAKTLGRRREGQVRWREQSRPRYLFGDLQQASPDDISWNAPELRETTIIATAVHLIMSILAVINLLFLSFKLNRRTRIRS